MKQTTKAKNNSIIDLTRNCPWIFKVTKLLNEINNDNSQLVAVRLYDNIIENCLKRKEKLKGIDFFFLNSCGKHTERQREKWLAL